MSSLAAVQLPRVEQQLFLKFEFVLRENEPREKIASSLARTVCQ
jgi:hypothetical protein